jgi:hypothetical protein
MFQSALHRLMHRFTAAAALVSAAACAALVMLWISSFWTAGSLVCNVHGRTFWAISQRNLIGLRFHRYQQGDEPRGWGFYPNPDFKRSSGLWDELHHYKNPPPGTLVNGRPFNRNLHEILFPAVGLGYRRTEYAGAQTDYSVYIPHWLASTAFALLPTVWYVRVIWPRRRLIRGCCVRCGYDLRATPNRCPECGREANAGVNVLSREPS